MRIVSWNVNGLNACIKNSDFDVFYEWLPDVICCQETKTKETPIVIDGYKHYYLPANQQRFCGNLIMSLEEPLEIITGTGFSDYDLESRVITAEFNDFFLVNTYAPNTVDKVERTIFRVGWSGAYNSYVKSLMDRKPVILCGDFNVSLSPIDYYEDNIRKHKIEEIGFESDERTAVEDLLNLGLVDAYRHLYPDETDCYTHWPNKNQARILNRGSRLDYFFVSREIIGRIKQVRHLRDITGSDHCPIELEVM